MKIKRKKRAVEKKSGKINWKIFICSLIVVCLVAYIGNIFTSKEVNSSWYTAIKPSITPPNWVFPIAWGILFYMMAIALYYSWINGGKHKNKAAILFTINFILNIMWSVFYFGMKNPLYGLVDIVLLWISILYLIIFHWKTNRVVSYLLIPYLLWVLFAALLNYLSIK